MYDSAHFREHLPAPVSKFLDSLAGQSHLEFQSQWSHPSCAIGMERPWISGTTKTFGTIEITRLVHPDGVSWMFCVVGTFFNAPFTHMHVLDDDHHSVIHSHRSEERRVGKDELV